MRKLRCFSESGNAGGKSCFQIATILMRKMVRCDGLVGPHSMCEVCLEASGCLSQESWAHLVVVCMDGNPTQLQTMTSDGL